MTAATDPHNARGYCFGHYERWKKLGHPDADRPLNTKVKRGASLADRLARRIPSGLSEDECWPWQGALGGRKATGIGYGKFTVNGRQYDAHRVAWELHSGRRVPPGYQVMHVVCDNPLCINPRHLDIGTNDDNIADMVSKSRQTLGTRNPRAALTEAAVTEIRSRGVNAIDELAAKYGVTASAVRRVLRRTTWKHLP